MIIGVNIKDPKLKNVIIDVFDPITIIQSLGRKRIAEGENITLYLRVPTENQIHNARYYKTNNQNLAVSCMESYMEDHFQKIAKQTFVGFWSSFFSNSHIKIVDDCSNVKRFMKSHVNKPVTPQQLVELFPSIEESARIVSYNKFLSNHNLPFRITPKRVMQDGKKITQWFVKSTNFEVSTHSRTVKEINFAISRAKDFCATPKSAKQIREFLGIKSRYIFNNEVLQPMLNMKILMPTNPANPHAANQKYVIFEKP